MTIPAGQNPEHLVTLSGQSQFFADRCQPEGRKLVFDLLENGHMGYRLVGTGSSRQRDRRDLFPARIPSVLVGE